MYLISINLKNKMFMLGWMIFISVQLSVGQEAIENSVIEHLAGELSMSSEESMDIEMIIEDLIYYHENPIDLNNPRKEDLQRLRLLTDFQVESLLDYLEVHGALLSLQELNYVYGFDSELIVRIMPFVEIAPVHDLPKLPMKKGRHEVFSRYRQTIQDVEGQDRFEGSPVKLYNRYSYKLQRKIFAGVTMEKDPGEAFFNKSNPWGFDYYSAHVNMNNYGIIKSFVAGDYKINLGQGLNVWSGFSFNKSAMTTNISKFSDGLRKYTSTDENLFFRGAGVTLDLNPMQLTLFYSSKKIDANIHEYDSTEQEARAVSSLQQTGLHRTEGEIFDENAYKRQAGGAELLFGRDRWRVGSIFSFYHSKLPIVSTSHPYKEYSSPGSEGYNISTHFQWQPNFFNLFGEFAYSYNGALAVVSGLEAFANENITLALLYRNYQRDYIAPFGGAFGENSMNNNEEGFYAGVKYSLPWNLKISAYADMFRFPWMKYRVDGPSKGRDFFVQTDYTPSRKFNMYLKYKQEVKGLNYTGEANQVTLIKDASLHRLRYHMNYGFPGPFSFRSRVEWAFYNHGNNGENGLLLFQDVLFHAANMPIDIIARYAIFDTDGYYSRIYTYENNVLYAFSIPAYQDKGTRAYLLFKYRPFDFLDCWLRVAHTHYPREKEIGSGLQAIAGNKKTDVVAQLRFKF